MRWMLAVALLVLLAGCSAPATDSGLSDAVPSTSRSNTSRSTIAAAACPGHWHSTFAIFLPSPGGEAHQVDFTAPRSPKGRIYYDYASGASQMTLALHMHQTGDEMGTMELGPTQWHMESNGQCVQVPQALRTIDVAPAEDRLVFSGGHAQVASQRGTFVANETSPLRWWLQQQDAAGAWTWQERTWAQIEMHDLQDGESLLVALGDYSEAQVAAMQTVIPAPISRA